MSEWTHSTCDSCWTSMMGDSEPFRMVAERRTFERCCYCGTVHSSGIYTRHDPKLLLCGGVHNEREEGTS